MTETKTFSFQLEHLSKKSGARAGIIRTPHGDIQTPSFVAVGTNGSIKAVDNTMVEQLGIDLMFCNTYHLILQPGADTVSKAGGLHSYINRTKPIITDSGGFQVFSMAYGGVTQELKSRGKKTVNPSVLKISEDGVVFRSYRDGSKHLLTPESSIQAQKKLGADIIIPLDELPPFHVSEQKLRDSFERTHRWQERSLQEHLRAPRLQAIYGVVHGGLDIDLRTRSIRTLAARPYDGLAIGGSLGRNRSEMLTMLEQIMPEMPSERPNHLLGIGDLESIEPMVQVGIDTFDSSYPTRSARHGSLFHANGTIKVKQLQHKDVQSPIEPGCPCPTCKRYSLGYMQHLYKANEPIFQTLATIHNLSFMVRKLKSIRKQIFEDTI